MTSTTTHATHNNAAAGRSPNHSSSPSHAVYHVRDIAGRDKGFWTRVGSAWAHGDSQGFNLQLECLPVDGRLTLRVIAEPRPAANSD